MHASTPERSKLQFLVQNTDIKHNTVCQQIHKHTSSKLAVAAGVEMNSSLDGRGDTPNWVVHILFLPSQPLSRPLLPSGWLLSFCSIRVIDRHSGCDRTRPVVGDIFQTDNKQVGIESLLTILFLLFLYLSLASENQNLMSPATGLVQSPLPPLHSW